MHKFIWIEKHISRIFESIDELQTIHHRFFARHRRVQAIILRIDADNDPERETAGNNHTDATDGEKEPSSSNERCRGVVPACLQVYYPCVRTKAREKYPSSRKRTLYTCYRQIVDTHGI